MLNRLFKSEHQRVEELLSAYIDGELSPKEQARVEKHLTQCADCAQNLHTLRQTVALLGQLSPVAVPRAFTIRPTQVAQRDRFFQTRRTYAYLRAATALATILFAVVLAGDVFLTDLAPYLAPTRVPEVIEREVLVEKVVVETVVVEVEKEVILEKEVPVTVEVEKEVVVEKEVLVTVEVEKEMAVEKAVEAEVPTEAPVLESKPAYAPTPSPAPAGERDELTRAPKPLPTPDVGAQEMEATGTPSMIEEEVLAGAPPSPDEDWVEATPTPMPTPLPPGVTTTAEPVFTPTAMPTAIAEVLPSTPLPYEPTVGGAVRPSRSGVILLRATEAGLLALVLVLAIATLVARRRQAR
jgi:anti-sigma factor RsiW